MYADIGNHSILLLLLLSITTYLTIVINSIVITWFTSYFFYIELWFNILFFSASAGWGDSLGSVLDSLLFSLHGSTWPQPSLLSCIQDVCRDNWIIHESKTAWTSSKTHPERIHKDRNKMFFSFGFFCSFIFLSMSRNM